MGEHFYDQILNFFFDSRGKLSTSCSIVDYSAGYDEFPGYLQQYMMKLLVLLAGSRNMNQIR